MNPQLLLPSAAPSLSQIEGLIGTDVELSGGEQGCKFPDLSLNKTGALRRRHIDGVVVHTSSQRKRHGLRALQFTQVAVMLRAQHLIKVSEGGQ